MSPKMADSMLLGALKALLARLPHDALAVVTVQTEGGKHSATVTNARPMFAQAMLKNAVKELEGKMESLEQDEYGEVIIPVEDEKGEGHA